ncbi:MAG: NapC/NirT family cytochrome c, partial [Chloroflexota bacterium]
MKTKIKNLLGKIVRFFFPPPGTPRAKRVLPYALLGVLTLTAILSSIYVWEYTNSPQFCGSTCHTMPPEFTTYLASPHARIDCVDCHIGRDFLATRVSRKTGDLRHVFATLFKTYEFPIRAHQLRPARETCERCHFPEKFSDDSLREILRFSEDIENTATTTYLLMKTGGGVEREGLGRGIHWHIQREVYYLPLDEVESQIPFVRVVESDGTAVDYVDIEAGFDPSTVNPEDLKLMDCITCHNRITHMIYPPEDSVETLLSREVISPDIPEIRLKAVEVLRAPYESKQAAFAGIAELDTYYKSEHRGFYFQNQEAIAAAITALQEIYEQSVFLEQKADWNTHPNNIGHEYSPGCFRCHDGKHLNEDEEAVRLECNLCHSIPVVAGPEDFIANIEVNRGIEPTSHLN